MTGDKDFDRLQTKGDPLEVLICRELDELSLILLPYARVWSRHIFPRRIADGSEVVPEWMPFAGCHYTALVRLHHALSAKRKIIAVCKKAEESGKHEATEEDYTRLLSVHAACTSFWDNLGASIDNFVHAQEEAKTALAFKKEKRQEISACPKCGAKAELKEKFVARTLSQAKNPKLYYAFERRHQFIHSILIPHRIEGGMIVFNLRHYDDAATDWSKDVYVWQNIDSQIQKDWDEVMAEFGATWSAFDAWIQANDKDHPNLDEHEAAVQTPIEPRSSDHSYSEFAPKPPGKPATTFSHPISGSKTGK
jgi:DNA-directed RNA polymerase subunit M/transcription elongation factor TFIIS